MWGRLPIAVPAFAYACVLAALPAQDKAADSTASVPVLKATVSEVTLNIAVHDRHGRPVRGLSPSDFHILDDGSPVKIDAFRSVSAEGGTAVVPRLVSFVFQSFEEQVADVIHNTALDVLKSVNAPDAYFSVWQIDQQLRSLRPFTQDRQSIDETLRTELLRDSRRSKHHKRENKHKNVHAPEFVSASASAPSAPDATLSGIAPAAIERCLEIERDRHVDPLERRSAGID